jgi:hypothetical protein
MAEIPHAKGQSSAAEGQSWLCPKARQRTAPKRKAAILLVDDERAVRVLRRDLMLEVGFDVMEVSAGKQVIRRILPNVGNVGQLPQSGTALRR